MSSQAAGVHSNALPTVKLHAHCHLLGKIIFYPERAGLGVLVTL